MVLLPTSSNVLVMQINSDSCNLSLLDSGLLAVSLYCMQNIRGVEERKMKAKKKDTQE